MWTGSQTQETAIESHKRPVPANAAITQGEQVVLISMSEITSVYGTVC